MNVLRVPARTAAVVVMAMGVSWPALAQQSEAPTPTSGVFGGAGRGTNSPLVLTTTFSGMVGNPEAAQGGSASGPLQPRERGLFPSFAGDLRLTTQGDVFNADASAETNLRYDQRRREFLNVDHRGTARLGWALGRRRQTRLTFSQDAAYSQSSLYRLFPSMAGTAERSEPIATSPGGYTATTPATQTYETAAAFEHSVTRRGSLRAQSSIRTTTFPSGAQRPVRAISFGGGYRQNLTQYAMLRLEYAYREGEYGGALDTRTVVHDLNLGVDYNRPLSRTRRTFFSASGGSSIVEGGTASEPSRYLVNGQASLRHLIGRSWEARLDYRRAVDFVEGFTEPLTSDGVTGAFSGLLTKRLDIAVTAGVSKGLVGAPVSGDSAFLTTMGSATARFAISRFAALYGSFVHYTQDMGPDVARPAGLPQTQTQQSIHVGVTLWAPLKRR